MRARNGIHIFPCLLLLLLAACGRGAEPVDTVQTESGETEVPVQSREPRDDGGQPQNGTARLQITGDHAMNDTFDVGCDMFPNKGLQFTFDRPGANAPQFVFRVDGYMTDGQYTAAVLVRPYYTEGSKASESTGSGQIKIVSQRDESGRSRMSGSFDGTFAGAAGSGRVAGNFEGCLTKDLVQ